MKITGYGDHTIGDWDKAVQSAFAFPTEVWASAFSFEPEYARATYRCSLMATPFLDPSELKLNDCLFWFMPLYAEDGVAPSSRFRLVKVVSHVLFGDGDFVNPVRLKEANQLVRSKLIGGIYVQCTAEERRSS